MIENWRELAKNNVWSEIDIYRVPEHERADLLVLLRQVVPLITVKNGMEKTERHALPHEIPNERLRPAAEILLLGELAAMVEGEPEVASKAWAETVSQARRYLDAAQADGEKTHGVKELSRSTHIASARDALEQIEHSMQWLTHKPEAQDDADWVIEALSEVAKAAFVAGRRVQAAWGKPIEHWAKEHLLTQEKRSSGGKSNKHPDCQKILATMRSMSDPPKKKNIKAAAYITFNTYKLGTSAGANESMWYRHNPKDKEKPKKNASKLHS